MSPRGAPLPVYKGVGEGEGRPSLWCALGGVLLPPGVGFPPPLPSSRSRSQGKGEEKRRKEGAQPLPLVQFGLGLGRGGARPALGNPSLFPVWPNKAQYFSRGIPVTLRYSEKYPNHSESFRSPNIFVQYIDLYVSTILRLLVMSMISSGTPNNIQSPNHITHIIQIVIER